MYSSSASPSSTTRPGRIPRSEWAAIITRHERGESASAIARAYGVTGPAIHYILKKGKAEQNDAAPGPEAREPATGEPEPRGPEAREPESPAPVAAREVVEAPGPTKPAPAVAATYESPLAQRFAEATGACLAAVEDLHLGRGSSEAVKDQLHQVRRAVAAIEIELSRMVRSAPVVTPATDEIEGTVKFFNREKGFGFVATDDGSPDVFVNLETLERSGLTTLQPRQRVRVSTVMGQKGPQAESITLL